MFYRLRRADGRLDPYSGGTLLPPGGETIALAASDVTITHDRLWRSPSTGARYPARWRLVVPAQAIELTIEPRLENQEWTDTIPYWEGAVTVAGQRGGMPVAGLGYVELTGYAGH
jgi:predicted secreted hydrolase